MHEMPKINAIPPAILAEQWYSFLHSMIGGLQVAYRAARADDPQLNQKVIADRIGRKASFVSRCLTGQQNMTARTIHDISRGIGYRPEIQFQRLDALVPANHGAISNISASGGKEYENPPLIESATAGKAVLLGAN
jgi:hypothetical protein